jgi:hypothetical protein
MGMVSLVYVSLADHMFTDDELKGLLQEARDNNQKLNVTGMLLYRDGFFIQALEGEDDVVERLYADIAKDPRHKNVLKVCKDPVTTRSFPDWSMGFNKMSTASLDQVPGYTTFLDNPNPMFFVEHPSHAKDLLKAFQQQIYF